MPEYLNDINQPLTKISETDIKYTNIYDMDGLIYGAPNWQSCKSFRKFSRNADVDVNSLTDVERRTYATLGKNTSGCFLRFKTDSDKVIIKAHVRRKYDFTRLTLNNSSGFDVYEVDDNGNYYHKNIIASKTGFNIFAEQFLHDKNKEIHIYFPVSNEIIDVYIGSKSPLVATETVKEPPIIFYGNSITQGGSATRSGNAFCNIVSRKLNNEIYNMSVSTCCKGFTSVAKYMGMFNARAIVVDYTRNATNIQSFENSYENFYNTLRKYHINTKIILMDTSNFNDDINYMKFDDVVYRTYQKAVEAGHNTYLLKQKELFEQDEWDLVTVDGIHYTDYGMFKLADAICDLVVKGDIKT